MSRWLGHECIALYGRLDGEYGPGSAEGWYRVVCALSVVSYLARSSHDAYDLEDNPLFHCLRNGTNTMLAPDWMVT
jgi:hypothetical protein